MAERVSLLYPEHSYSCVDHAAASDQSSNSLRPKENPRRLLGFCDADPQLEANVEIINGEYLGEYKSLHQYSVGG